MTTMNRVDGRAWIVVGACLTQFTVIGLLFAYSLFFKMFEIEFGWSRALLSGAASVAFFVMGLLAIVVGRLSDRFGPRVVLGLSGLLYGCGFALISVVSEPWHLLMIFGVFISIGVSTHDVVTLSTVAKWYEHRRGMMTGVVKVGTAMGQVLVPPVIAVAMAVHGWKMTALGAGGLAALLLLFAAWLMKGPARAAGTVGPVRASDSGFHQVLRTRAFWTLAVIQLLFLPSLVTVPLHIVVHGMDLGLRTQEAAMLLSVIGASSILGRLAMGSSGDKIGGRRAYVYCLLPLLISLLALLAIKTIWPLFIAVALYGFAHGGLFTIVAPAIAEYFGTRAHGTIFGAIVLCGTIGGALGPIVAGRIFDVTGSYDPAFMTLAVMVSLGLGLALSLPTATTGKTSPAWLA